MCLFGTCWSKNSQEFVVWALFKSLHDETEQQFLSIFAALPCIGPLPCSPRQQFRTDCWASAGKLTGKSYTFPFRHRNQTEKLGWIFFFVTCLFLCLQSKCSLYSVILCPPLFPPRLVWYFLYKPQLLALKTWPFQLYWTETWQTNCQLAFRFLSFYE